MQIEQTNRGFSLVRFVDAVGSDCSLQDSSIASESCCWFGIAHSPKRKDDVTRMHLTVEMTRRIGRAMCAALEGRPFEDFELEDRYGICCKVRSPSIADAIITMGVLRTFNGSRSYPMHLGRTAVERLMPFLLGFIATGTISGEGGASELEDPTERVLDVKIPASMLDRTDIGETGVSAQDLIDAFTTMQRAFGDDVGLLGHDNAVRLGRMAERIAHLNGAR